jgi:hypothetical protein
VLTRLRRAATVTLRPAMVSLRIYPNEIEENL